MPKTLKDILEVYAPKSKDEKRFKDKHVVAKYKLDNPSKQDDVFTGSNVRTISREATKHGYDLGKDEEVYESSDYSKHGPKAIVVSHSAGKYKVHHVGKHFADGIKVGERLSDTELDDAAEMGAKIINRNTETKTKIKEEALDEKHLTPAEMKKREEIAGAIKRQHPDYSMSKKMAIATAQAKKVAEEIEDLAEGEEAHKQFNHYHGESAKLLKSITRALSSHYNNVSANKNIHWGNVDDIKRHHRQLQDLNDQILQSGEYAKPLTMKEDTQIDEEIEQLVDIVYESLSDENKEVFLNLLENNPDQLIEFLEQLEVE
jgi:hypothetical protein